MKAANYFSVEYILGTRDNKPKEVTVTKSKAPESNDTDKRKIVREAIKSEIEDDDHEELHLASEKGTSAFFDVLS